jgi:hypothetical protein
MLLCAGSTVTIRYPGIGSVTPRAFSVLASHGPCSYGVSYVRGFPLDGLTLNLITTDKGRTWTVIRRPEQMSKARDIVEKSQGL